MSDHIQTVQLAHLPSTHSIHIALYHSVTNASFLHEQLLTGNTDFEYALIDASVIVSKVQALAAAFRAINDSFEGRLKTRNVHSEIVFNLSPNNNIAESFRRFGITPSTTQLLVIKVSDPLQPSITASSISAHLSSSIQGTAVPFSDTEIAKCTDLARVKKIYKLNNVPSLGGGGKKTNGVVNGVGSDVEERKELEFLILGAMALRGVS